MELQAEQKAYIKEAFAKMKIKEDFLALLNYAKEIIYSQKTLPFEIKQINYHCNPKLNPKRYFQFSVKKKSGAERIIHAPCKGLKAIQKCLNLIFQAIYDVHPAATGFVPDKSIVDNARFHCGNIYVYNIDLKDFFPSIEAGRIFARLQYPPFNLTEKTGRKDLANIITWLCCHEMEVERLDNKNQWYKVRKNVLPQGSPTSPILTNIICQKLDFYLSAVAKRFGLNYSRYADDITFSSKHNVFQEDSIFLNELHRIITEQYFIINPSKTRLQKTGYRQEVTGLLVNEKPNVQQRYIKQLRMWLYYWESYGYERASSYFLPQYKADKGHTKKGTPNMNNVIAGKLDYLKMVKGADNEMYLKLKNKFSELSNKGTANPVTIKEKPESVSIKKTSNQVRLKIESTDAPHEKTKLMAPRTIKEGIELPYEEVFENKQSLNEHSPYLIRHNPLFVVNFLKNFKYDNETGLKDLVHKPFDIASFDFRKILEKVRTHPNFNKGEKVKEFKGKLPVQIWKDTNSLIDFLSTTGLEYFNKTGNHPIDDLSIAKAIQNFKRNYRFGSEKTEYSVLHDLINNILNKNKLSHSDTEKSINYSFSETDTSGQFSASQIVFLPDDKKFAMRAGFFTWVPNVRNALWWIFEGILKHSNINGIRNFTRTDKRIEISIERSRDSESDHTKVTLVISDCNSVLTKAPESLFKDLTGSEPYTQYLRSIADWTVECDYNDKAYRLLMLPEGSFEEITYPVNGFKHIITFYD